jgi:hypothetical protein
VTKVPDRRGAARKLPLSPEIRIALQETSERPALRETVLDALKDALAVPKSVTRAGDGPSRDEGGAA